MTKKITLGVLFGGASDEHDVSIMSAKSILAVLSPEKYDIVQIGITRDGVWFHNGDQTIADLESGNIENATRVILLPEPGNHWLYSLKKNGTGHQIDPMVSLDIIFPILHGPFGEDGKLQALFELSQIPYVGANVLTSAVGMDKGYFKDLMKSWNIPTAEYFMTTRHEIQNNLDMVLEQAETCLSYPMFVKPANMGSSVGINKCKNQEQLKAGLYTAIEYDNRILVEKGINAREIEVSVLGNQFEINVSVPGEVTYDDEFYSYEAKYFDNRTKLSIPAEISDTLRKELQELSAKIFKAVNCDGMARIDFLVEKGTNDIYISEINTIPGFTHASMYPKLWEASGIKYRDLVDKLIELSVKQ